MTAAVGGAFLAAWGFAVLYQVPWVNTWVAGLVGAMAWWVAATLGGDGGQGLGSDFVGALTVGVLAELAARWRRTPATLFMVPGIIAFVPGLKAYQAMLAILRGAYLKGLQMGMDAMLAAAALGLGLAVATAVVRPLLRSGRPR